VRQRRHWNLRPLRKLRVLARVKLLGDPLGGNGRGNGGVPEGAQQVTHELQPCPRGAPIMPRGRRMADIESLANIGASMPTEDGKAPESPRRISVC
jgi:hypothetical protein